jgi:L-alanine-DL-glutamate epimerase-like enolase superfamily enzyme
MKTNSEIRVYGVVAEFNSAEDILKAAKRAVEYGFQKMEAYTPFPVHGLDETIRKEDHRIKWIIFLCGFLGAIVGISMQ